MYNSYNLTNVFGGCVHSNSTASKFIATVQGVEYHYVLEHTSSRKHSFIESPDGAEYDPVTVKESKDQFSFWFASLENAVYAPIGMASFKSPGQANLMDPEFVKPWIKRHLVNIMHTDPKNLSVDKIDNHLRIRHDRLLKMGDFIIEHTDVLVFNHVQQVGDACLWQDNLSIINNPQPGRYAISYEQVQHRRTPVASNIAVKAADELYGPYFPAKAWAYADEDAECAPCCVNVNVLDTTQSVIGIWRNKVYEPVGLIVQYSNAEEHKRPQYNKELRAARDNV